MLVRSFSATKDSTCRTISLRNVPIVASQPVDALDIEKVVRLEFFDQLFVLRAVKVLAGLLVHENVFFRDGHLPQGDELPVLVLLAGADPDVAVCS